jgi:hypothetical protein
MLSLCPRTPAQDERKQITALGVPSLLTQISAISFDSKCNINFASCALQTAYSSLPLTVSSYLSMTGNDGELTNS